MKNQKNYAIIGFVILFIFNSLNLYAGPDTAWAGLNVPTSSPKNKGVNLQIGGAKPSLQLDSAREILTTEGKYVLVFDSTGKVVAKMTMDSLKKKLTPPTEVPQMFSSGYTTCAQSYYPDPFMSMYTDSSNIANSTPGYIAIQCPNQTCQIRRLRDDWPTSGSYDFIRYGPSIAFIGNYVYVLCFQMDYSTYSNYTPRVYRYDKNNLAAGGTLMTIAGLSLLVSNNPFFMACNGANFYFSHSGGNSSNSNVITKYSLSGTTLNYVSSVTCGISTDFRNSFLVDNSENLYTFTDVPTSKIRKFSFSGTLLGENATVVNFLMNWNDNFYGLRYSSASPIPFLFYERINK